MLKITVKHEYPYYGYLNIVLGHVNHQDIYA